MSKQQATGPAQPDDIERPERDASTWRDDRNHAHKSRKSEKRAAEAEKADSDKDGDVPLSAVRTPPD